MSRHRLRRRLQEFFRKLCDARRAARRKLTFMRLGLEPLESRRLLTVRVAGADIVAHGNDNWSDPANWVGNVAPQPETHPLPDQLLLPTTINDDLSANFRLRSITISGSNFNITGSSPIQLMEISRPITPRGQ